MLEAVNPDSETKGWALKGRRAIIHLPNSKGPNIHLISGMTSTGLVYPIIKRGSLRNEGAHQWLKEMLNTFRNQGNEFNNTVVVCDNASCHSRLESILENEIDSDVEIIRLAPYSCVLNPIENAWSKIKSVIKEHISRKSTSIVNPISEINMGEQRLIWLE
ncbi:hypothetical protein A3Q56_01238 [Intoshia linei]|uniref:Tc1-like transposase DDE domain-containing protein n=1 Tax=Intoshia linei TaxID=1819745 RepID=A0A177BBW7_9BILA|nr:hypothetical protein A3Q56_01238 [Intoshia linei]